MVLDRKGLAVVRERWGFAARESLIAVGEAVGKTLLADRMVLFVLDFVVAQYRLDACLHC